MPEQEVGGLPEDLDLLDQGPLGGLSWPIGPEDGGEEIRPAGVGQRRPGLLDRRPEPPSWSDAGTAALAALQSLVQTGGAAVAGPPLAAGQAVSNIGRAVRTAPRQLLDLYDAVEGE